MGRGCGDVLPFFRLFFVLGVLFLSPVLVGHSVYYTIFFPFCPALFFQRNTFVLVLYLCRRRLICSGKCGCFLGRSDVLFWKRFITSPQEGTSRLLESNTFLSICQGKDSISWAEVQFLDTVPIFFPLSMPNIPILPAPRSIPRKNHENQQL